MSDRHAVKIAYIGGGSRYWAYELMADLALSEHLDGHLALYDIDHAAAASNVKVADDIFSRPEAVASFTVTAEKTPAAALKGADFVVCSIEPGPVTMRYADLVIPATYGILQTVGDSTGPGGIFRALRSIPVKAHYAHLVMQHCPGAWVINYTNPMTLCTAAMYAAEPSIRAFGCCHEVFGTQWYLAGLAARTFGAAAVDRTDIRLDIAGVNHFTFATKAVWNGNDLFAMLRRHGRESFFADRTTEARRRIKKGEWFSSDKLIAYDFFRRFGAFGAAGDRHLAEFVPWYLTSEKNLHRWGVVLTPYWWRLEKAKQHRRSTRYHCAQLKRSGEEGVAQITALLGGSPLDTNVNLPNKGQIAGAPLGTIVETYAQFRKNSIQPVVAGSLPPGLSQLVNRVIAVQQMTLDAGLHCDRDRAFQALLNDPLVNIPTDAAWKMFGEMLVHAKKYLPGWKIRG
jgi:galacturan 1,4-alpha-galacturonidase